MNYENVTVLRTKLPYKAGPGGFECLFKQYLIACVVLDGYLREQAKQAVREEQYYENSAVYKKCLKVLDSNPSLQLKKETAREIKTVTDLVENEFLVVSDDYVGWVNG